MTNSLEIIAACTTASVGILAVWTPITLTAFNTLDIHRERTNDWKQTKEGPKPSLYEALRDSTRFSWAYFTSLGRINTSNYKF